MEGVAVTGNLILELATFGVLVRGVWRWLHRSPHVPAWMVRDVSYPQTHGYRVVPHPPFDWSEFDGE